MAKGVGGRDGEGEGDVWMDEGSGELGLVQGDAAE
jgi:hypothetical protein